MPIQRRRPPAASTRGSAPRAGGVRARVVHRASLGLLAVLVGLTGVVGPSLANAQTAPATPGTEARAADHERVLRRYCVSCHNGRLRTAGLALDEVDPAHPGDAVEVWEQVVVKLRGRTMPPPGRPRPDEATYAQLATALESALDRHAAAHPDPGRPLVHRMNRTEYRNAVRDLLGFEVDVDALPPDNEAHGFDNIADALSVSPLLLESYVSTARKVARLAVGDPGAPPATLRFSAPATLSQRQHLDGLPPGTRGGLRTETYLPADAEYEVRVRLGRTGAGSIGGIAEEHTLALALDGKAIAEFTVGDPDVYTPLHPENTNLANAVVAVSRAFTADEHMHVRLPLPAGAHTLTATFVGKPAVRNAMTPSVDAILLTGPFDARPAEGTATPSRARVFSCQPASVAEETPCADRILTRLGRLAYRRPLTDAERETLLGFYHDERAGGGFESGIELALRFLLASSQFVFRVEAEPDDALPGTAYPVADLDLASRLAFFLWSSLPDDELLAAAEAGRLGRPAELARQVRRMLADPRSSALVENFAGQWLFLRNLESHIPDATEFPAFDENLRRALRRETELLFEHVMREDRSVVELLTADYTFVNERLADHYGIPGVYGDRFRQVPVVDDNRRGLLGHGSILTVTSYPNRTSPVLRGKWVLDQLLGAPPPPPPPDVPQLEENEGTTAPRSVRERMEQHRANPVCASCHAKMDPIGFALERFDAIGRGRTTDGGVPIDASGRLPSGASFDGPGELRDALLERPEEFVGTFTRKLLTYAVGRGLEASDAPAVRRIVREAAGTDDAFSSIVTGVVLSDPFRLKMKRPEPETIAAVDE